MFIPRLARAADKDAVIKLYRAVAQTIGGIAREESEITDGYVENFMLRSSSSGIELVVDHPEKKNELIGKIHCYKPGPEVFRHILSDLTIVIHPQFQGKGVGKYSFNIFLR